MFNKKNQLDVIIKEKYDKFEGQISFDVYKKIFRKGYVFGRTNKSHIINILRNKLIALGHNPSKNKKWHEDRINGNK